MQLPINHGPEPVLTIRPSSGWQSLRLSEIWQYRDLLWVLAQRDIRLRYKQTILGVVWVVLQPLISAGIFAFVFGRVAKLPSDGVPYFVFSYAGLLAWNLFNSTLTKASGSLVGNANLVSKVYFPRLILPLSTLFSSLLDFGVAFLIMIILMITSHIVPGPGILLLPVWLALILILSTGVGLCASSLMVSYRDVQHIMPVLLQFLLYASPVAYAVSAVPHKLRLLYYINPVSSILEAFRWSLLNRGTLQPGFLVYSAVFSIGSFFAGAYAFKRMERKFADVI